MVEFSTLVGVLIGGGLTWLASWQVQRSRDRWASLESDRQSLRDAAIRMETRRWQSYVDFLTSANVLYSQVRRPGLSASPTDWRADVFEAMEQVDASMSAAFLVSTENLVVVAVSQVVKASRELSLVVATAPSEAAILADLLLRHRQAVITAEREIRAVFTFSEPPSLNSKVPVRNLGSG